MTVGKAVEIPMRLKLDDFKKIIDELNNFKKQLFRGNRDEVRDLNELKKSISGLHKDQMEHMTSVRSEMGAAGMRYKDLMKFQDKIVRGAAAIDKARASGDKSALHAAEVRFSKELQHQSKLNKQQLDHISDFQKISDKTKKEMVEGVTDGVREGLSNLNAADFKSLGALITSSLKKSGGVLQTASAVAAKKEGEGGAMMSSAMTMLAPLLATAGEVVMVLGSLVVVIGAVIALFVHMDNRISGLNKTLVDSGFAAGDFAASLRDMSAGMKTVRETFAKKEGFDFLRKWSLTQDDALKILGAFNKAGYTKVEMTAGATGEDAQQLKMRNTAEVAIKYGALLGESGEAMAEKIATHMEEAGDTIEQVDAGFASMYESAMKSGFGTSRFFNMVLQATSGLNVYNVRLEEAAGLLGLLGKSMSSIRAGQLLGDLAKKGGEKSSADRLKDAELQGAGRALEQHKYAATQVGGDFIKDVVSSGKLGALIDALKKHSIKIPEYDEKLMSGDTPEAKAARNKFAASVFGATSDFSLAKRGGLGLDVANATGKGQPAVQQMLEQFKVFSKRGDPRLLAAGADQFSSATTTLLQRFDILDNVLRSRGKNWESDYLSKMAGENILGIDSAQMRDMISIVTNQKGTFHNLDKALKAFKEKGGDAEEFEKLRKDLAKEYGYTVDKDGKKYAAKLDEAGNLKILSGPLNDLRDFVREFVSRSEEQDVAKRALEQAQAAQTIQSDTTSVTIILTQIKDFLEFKLFDLLTDMKDYLSDIAEFFGASDKEKYDGTQKDSFVRKLNETRADAPFEGDAAKVYGMALQKYQESGSGVTDAELERVVGNAAQKHYNDTGTNLSRDEILAIIAHLKRLRRSSGSFSHDDNLEFSRLTMELKEAQKAGNSEKVAELQKKLQEYSRTPAQNDFLLRMSGATGAVTPLTQFNAQDSLSVMGARPGQAVAQAGGTTGSGPAMTFHNHFYNDARANYNQNRKLLAALKHGRPA